MLRKSLVALAMGTFALGIAEFSMMGILGNVATYFNISIPEAGDCISAYSAGVAIGSPCLLFLSRISMKKILLYLCAIMVLGNIFVACATGYYGLLAGRFLSGLPHGAYFGVAAIVASRLVGYGEKAMAVAIMVSGMTIANVLGVPFATWLVHLLNWRAAFFLVAMAGLCSFLGIWREIPPIGAAGKKNSASLRSQFLFLRSPAPWLIFAGTFLGQGSLYCWYSYIEPIMIHVTGIPQYYITGVMMIAGIGMVTGGLVSGKLSDKFGPALVPAITCLCTIPVLWLLYAYSSIKILALILTFIGAGAIFAIGGPLQYLIVRYSKGGEMLGGAGIQVAFNVSNAVSALLGGWAIGAGYGLTSPALTGIPLAISAAIILFYFNHRYEKNANAQE